ncbi:MAG: BlaI/MecI/CopY family transcriptional regulator [Evtepia sp.]
MVKLTDNEWAILEVLWADGPCELGDLVSALAPTHPWRRNTVHTYLTRMESKGLVAIEAGARTRIATRRPSTGSCVPAKPGVSSWIKFMVGPRET